MELHAYPSTYREYSHLNTLHATKSSLALSAHLPQAECHHRSISHIRHHRHEPRHSQIITITAFHKPYPTPQCSGTVSFPPLIDMLKFSVHHFRVLDIAPPSTPNPSPIHIHPYPLSIKIHNPSDQPDSTHRRNPSHHH